ncbi:phosphatidylinositol glycan anchor biosynthesis class U protein-like [Pollicipes pollicipes]|uniref:phosphatidylinositol glycan anchor biosynthesis class U protein-like n=1 Tax=Pollicipes pollicipes TaxID=41117 RepID=UPI001884D744|nr:phosphatidylinositol glycan anchor biosynthesis class U protein-like [Pollicipes pollicipes]
MHLLLFIGGALLRLYLMSNSFFKNLCDGTIFSTPLTSWSRVTEGYFLMQQGISPYEGDMVHESPLTLILYSFLIKYCEAWIPIIFILVDICTAHILMLTAQAFIKKQLLEQKARPPPASGAAPLPVTEEQLQPTARLVAAVYLFNPCTAVSCAALSTAGLHQLPLALVFYTAVTGRWPACVACLGVSCYLDLYPAVLLVPLLALAADAGRSRLLTALGCAAVTGALLLLSAHGLGGWSFLRATYGFMLWTWDLSPNVGLFWYFFTEMFQHFESLFIATFQINAFIYAVPLTLRFRDRPVLVMFALLVLMVIFKSYPSVAEAGLYLALLPLWRPLAPYARYAFPVSCFYLSVTVLAPVMWTLWIHAGSANANFFFAVTLAYNAAQIFLVTDLLFAQLKRDHALRHGSNTEVDGKPAKLVLC